jgi:hypothetical protein
MMMSLQDKPNPPKEGPYWVCNDLVGVGYADYRVGRCYVSCDAVEVRLGDGGGGGGGGRGEGRGCVMPTVDFVAERREVIRLQMLEQSAESAVE